MNALVIWKPNDTKTYILGEAPVDDRALLNAVFKGQPSGLIEVPIGRRVAAAEVEVFEGAYDVRDGTVTVWFVRLVKPDGLRDTVLDGRIAKSSAVEKLSVGRGLKTIKDVDVRLTENRDPVFEAPEADGYAKVGSLLFNVGKSGPGLVEKVVLRATGRLVAVGPTPALRRGLRDVLNGRIENDRLGSCKEIGLSVGEGSVANTAFVVRTSEPRHASVISLGLHQEESPTVLVVVLTSTVLGFKRKQEQALVTREAIAAS
ncbi:MAG: hypothetical protein Q9164_003836 [Protoblastenia rupestris]